MRFSKPVYLDKENLFITSNTPVTDSDLDRLNRFGIQEVMTAGELLQLESQYDPNVLETSLDDMIVNTVVDDELQPLKAVYDNLNRIKITFGNLFRESTQIIQDVFKKTMDEKPLEVTPVREIAERLTDFVRSNQNISYLILANNPPGYYLYNQIANSTFYSLILGKLLEYSRPKMIDLGISCLLADIGMSKVPAVISVKNEQLTDEEFKTIMKHTILGYQIFFLKKKLKNNLAIVALQHHERYDGNGYPQKAGNECYLRTSQNLFYFRQLFFALVTNRPHRKKILPHEAIKSMISMDVGKFDLKLVRTLLNHLSLYPVGSCIELSDKRIGVVLGPNLDKPIRPFIRIIKDEYGKMVRNLILVDLLKETNLFISRPVDLQEISA
ncbi:PF11871 domain protein [Leptospira interrogans serovar Copenhageni/Icterohaemorrhagiae]|nr:PF11871 domain protein [Leptospira interrogans serovar Copenhageni/Icterohaemorrhagiae]